jgi:nitroreductase
MMSNQDNSIFFQRHSKRSFLDKDIPPEVLDRLFEIVRWSPSAGNNQPWRFVFVRDAERKDAFMKALPRGNQWAAAAPVLIAVCARKEDDGVREDDPVEYYQFACGLAVMSLLLGATHLGLMGHPMGGYDAFGIKKALKIPDEYHVICIVALGYEGPIEQLDERTAKKDAAERTRKPLDEIISIDKFDF